MSGGLTFLRALLVVVLNAGLLALIPVVAFVAGCRLVGAQPPAGWELLRYVLWFAAAVVLLAYVTDLLERA